MTDIPGITFDEAIRKLNGLHVHPDFQWSHMLTKDTRLAIAALLESQQARIAELEQQAAVPIAEVEQISLVFHNHKALVAISGVPYTLPQQQLIEWYGKEYAFDPDDLTSVPIDCIPYRKLTPPPSKG